MEEEYIEYSSEEEECEEIELIDEEKYDYWELYYEILEYIHSYFLTGYMLNEVSYFEFFKYMMSIKRRVRWDNSYKNEKRVRDEEVWYNENKRYIKEIRKMIEKEIEKEIDEDDLKGFCYMYSEKKII